MLIQNKLVLLFVATLAITVAGDKPEGAAPAAMQSPAGAAAVPTEEQAPAGAAAKKEVEQAPAGAQARVAEAPKTTGKLDDVTCAFATDAEAINKLADQCNLIKSECQDKLPYGKLNSACLSKLSFQLSSANYDAIIDSGTVKNIPVKTEFVKHMIDTVPNWKDKWQFVTLFLKEKDLSEILFKEYVEKPSVLKQFLTEATIPALTLDGCKQIATEKIVRELDAKAFAKIEGNCFAAIPEVALKALSKEQVAAINPDAFESITAKQAKAFQDVVKIAITEAQAAKWGSPPNVPKNWLVNKKSRLAYIEGHACAPTQDWKALMEKSAYSAMEKRCTPIWTVEKNAAISIHVNTLGTMLATLVVLAVLI